MLSNLESVGDLVGSLKGIGDGIEEDDYIEGLIKQAHGKATNVFNVAAAATASTGRMAHVYEYGTHGITPGQPKFADPTSPAARLWVHWVKGSGGNQNIGYSFRPALNRNPQPTVASTGVSSKYLAKLSKRKYVFWNRAFVMETGQTVSIKAKNGDFLFVPFGNTTPTNPANTRGFVMWNSTKLGAITARPGQKTKGEFTKFWMAWWATAGNEIIENDMRVNVTMDIEKAVAEAAKRAAAEKVKPVQAANIPAAATGARAWARNLFKRNKRMEIESV
jgi:hypothetical protein